jgi:cell division protein FtsQ
VSVLARKKVNRVKPAPKKRRRAKARVRRVPSLPDWRRVLRPLRPVAIVAAAVAVMLVAWRLLDRPVTAIAVTAPFQRVTPMQIEDHVRRGLSGGILSSDLAGVRASLESLSWIDSVRIRRRWPGTLMVEVTEQVAAARWGDSGLLNTRGELFVDNTRHVPMELPVLSGPAGSQWQVAQRYLTLRGPLLEAGLQLLSVTLDRRGSWRLTMARGIEVRLGRHAVDQRIDRFLSVVTPIIAGRTEVVDYVDLRYTNGFAIGWSAPARDRADQSNDEGGADA